MENKFSIIGLIAGFLLYGTLMFYAGGGCNKKEDNIDQKKTDTIIVKEVHHYHEIANNRPINITIQQKADTNYRKQKESEEIITGVKITPKGKNKEEVSIQTVDTNGVIKESKHLVEKGSITTIDNNGVNEKKKTGVGKFLVKLWKGTKTVAIIAFTAVSVIAIEKAL